MSSNIKTFPNLDSISAPFKGILLDAYGVFWGGNSLGLLPGSKEAMEQLVSDGKIVGILSNTTQLAAKEMHKLHTHGLMQDRHFHFLVTSGEIAKSLFLHEELPFATPRKKYWLFGSVHPGLLLMIRSFKIQLTKKRLTWMKRILFTFPFPT